MFKLLIGLSAALLVLRMIFEGYQYVVTDVPFLKANAKSKLFEAFFGLLLALSAYLILNTINPKLVSNKIEISQIDITVDEVEDYNYTEADYKSLMQQGQQYGITNYKCPDAQVISGGGVVNDGRIKNKVCSVLENGALKPKGIVIHGTAGTNNSDSILRGWTTNNILWDKGVRSVTIKGKSLPIAPSSTHFIVDKDGTISQAVRLNKTTNHCAKCTKSGSTNSTSISIEVVMACIKDCGTPRSAKKSVWEQPTSAQVQSTTYLVNYLLKEFALNKNTDIYVHGEEASNRTYNEGRNTLDAIRSYLR